MSIILESEKESPPRDHKFWEICPGDKFWSRQGRKTLTTPRICLSKAVTLRHYECVGVTYGKRKVEILSTLPLRTPIFNSDHKER